MRHSTLEIISSVGSLLGSHAKKFFSYGIYFFKKKRKERERKKKKEMKERTKEEEEEGERTGVLLYLKMGIENLFYANNRA